MSEHYRRLEAMYLAAPINELYKPSLEISKGRAVVSMEVDPRFFHAADALHGAVYFKALDDAAFFAASSVVTDRFVLTASFHLHFLRPVTSGRLRAVGTLQNSSQSLLVADAELFVGDERVLARGSGSFARSRIALNSVESYRDAAI